MELPEIISQIESLRQELAAMQPLTAEQQDKLNRKFRLEFNYNSNHIEGNTLTYGETELLLIFGATKGDHDKREYDEMEAHDVAYTTIQEWAANKELPLAETDIKNLNKIILVKPFWKDAVTPDGQQTRREIKVGNYKEYPNSVRLLNGEIFHYTSPTDTSIQMGELMKWYRAEEEKKEIHPVMLAALLHYRFVRIHPFDDGNGRISRLLMNYVLLRNGYPPIIIKSTDKKNYLHALHLADAGFLDDFIAYIIAQVKWSLEISLKAAKGENIEEVGDIDKDIALLKIELKTATTIAIPKTVDVIQKLYFDNLSSFIEQFEKRIYESFHEFFNDWHVHGMVNNKHDSGGKNYIDNAIKGGENIYSIELNVHLAGFNRNQKDDFSISVKLEMLFHRNNYELNTYDTEGAHKYLDGKRIYNRSVSQEEKDEIINNTLKYILKHIKAKKEK